MQRSSRTRWLGLLLGSLYAVSGLLPEIGHSLAHRHLTEAEAHQHGSAGPVHVPYAQVELEEAQGSTSHLHHDLRIVSPTKLVADFVNKTSVVGVTFEEPLRLHAGGPAANVEVRADSWHGLPPPSRAPPLI